MIVLLIFGIVALYFAIKRKYAKLVLSAIASMIYALSNVTEVELLIGHLKIRGILENIALISFILLFAHICYDEVKKNDG